MGQFAEMFEDVGIKKSAVVWMVILNILRFISIAAGLVFIVLWIITTNPVFGWALLWAVVGVILTSVASMILGLRVMTSM